jgi:hypothetical protein
MVSDFSIAVKKKHLVMTITGMYEYWDFINYPEHILDACKNHKLYRVLVDVRPVIADDISMIELYFIGEKIAQVLSSKVKLAIVWKKQALSEFLVDVASNRSAFLRVFEAPKRAEFWLLNNY